MYNVITDYGVHLKNIINDKLICWLFQNLKRKASISFSETIGVSFIFLNFLTVFVTVLFTLFLIKRLCSSNSHLASIASSSSPLKIQLIVAFIEIIVRNCNTIKKPGQNPIYIQRNGKSG